MHFSERAHVGLFYKFLLFSFLILTLSFETAEAAGKKKKTALKKTKTSIAKMAKAKPKIARIPAAKNQMKVPRGVPTKLPEKVQSSQPQSSLRAPAGVSDSQKSLEIRGQSRNLSMLLVLKNRHENIDFVKPRETYREEIQKTDF